MRRGIPSVRSVALPTWLAAFMALSALTAMASDRKAQEEVKSFIVMIEAGLPGGGEEFGAGIILGRNRSERGLYVVTANHVVRPDAQDAEKVKVRVRWRPGEKFDAEILDSDPRLDWAVLKVEGVDLPSGLSLARLGDAGSLQRGDKVFYIGYPTGNLWDMNEAPGLVKDNHAPSIFFESVLLEQGHSGGALLDENLGIVGLLRATQTSRGEAVNIQSLLKILEGYGYPVELEPGARIARSEPPAPAGDQGGDDLLSALAAKGAILSKEIPLAAAIREREPGGPIRRGFDIGMAACEGHTEWGAGKQKIFDSLSPAEQRGFGIARDFSLERNNNIDRATLGAAIAAKSQDPQLAAVRAAEPPGLYTLGFDIATAIFGDRALGAQGNTEMGPGAQGIRDKLSPAGQRGFDAAVKLHLSRNQGR